MAVFLLRRPIGEDSTESLRFSRRGLEGSRLWEDTRRESEHEEVCRAKLIESLRGYRLSTQNLRRLIASAPPALNLKF